MNSLGIILVTCLIAYIKAERVLIYVQDGELSGDCSRHPPHVALEVTHLPDDQKNLGCFQDSPYPRNILKGRSACIQANTPGNCIAFCKQRSYTYAGVEFGYWCMCGNVEPNYAKKIEQHYCDYPCPGGQYQTCGGRYKIDIYQLKEAPLTAEVVPSAAPTPTFPVPSLHPVATYSTGLGLPFTAVVGSGFSPLTRTVYANAPESGYFAGSPFSAGSGSSSSSFTSPGFATAHRSSRSAGAPFIAEEYHPADEAR